MAHTAGVTITTLTDKKIAIIDLEKYGKELRPFFKKIGITTEVDEDDEFEKEWAAGIPLEEARQKTLAFVRGLEWKKKK